MLSPRRPFRVAAGAFCGLAALFLIAADQPGDIHIIHADHLPPGGPTTANVTTIVQRPGQLPRVPAGMRVRIWASGFHTPRVLRVAPDGTIFLAESGAGRIIAFRMAADSSVARRQIFAAGLSSPYGIAFWPVDKPAYVYVAQEDRVMRFPWQPGNLAATGPPELIARLPSGGEHWTRDLVFSADGSRLFVSVGSATNMAEDGMAEEARRADVLVMDPTGHNSRVYASGLRNCSGLARQPGSNEIWCAVNERDGMGDNLPPDYITHIVDHGFYGWPWYYLGNHRDKRVGNPPAGLAGSQVIVPDVLVQAHSAPLGIVFYQGSLFPAWRGDALVTFHGSWNRANPTGYKLVLLHFRNGVATGEVEDVLDGFLDADQTVWGRPVGVAVAPDGSVLMSEDANGTIWRIASR